MKNVIFLLALMSSLCSLKAQPPDAFKYQAVARNAVGEPLINQSVTFRISILQTTSSGTIVYQEIHPTLTNNLGLANLEIGTGAATIGNISTIDWGLTDYFLKIEIDPLGGTSYQNMGTTQLLSVPYAMHARTAGTSQPAGSTGQVQFNASGSFGAESNLFWDASNKRLGLGNSSPDYTLDVAGNMGINQYLYHNDDDNTHINFSNDRMQFSAGGINMLDLYEGPQDSIVFGNGSDIDFNFNNKAFLSGSNGYLGLGTKYPSFKLDIASNVANGMRVKTDDNAWLVLDKGASTANTFLALRSGGSDLWIVGTWESNNDFLIKNWGNGGSTFIIDDASSAIGLNTSSPYSSDMLGLYPGDDFSYGIYLYQTRTISGTLYGLDAVLNSSYTGSQSIYGVYGSVTKSGNSGSTKYGVRGYVTDDETGSTRYNYGVYGYSYVGSSTGTSYAYGVRAAAGGYATYEYGLYYSGGLAGSGTKSAVVRTHNGPKEVYCQESPGNWFEDFGEGNIQNGQAIIQIPMDYLQTVTINSQYPMKVFITPNANLGNWWVEKRETSFTVYAPDAPNGAGFDFRVVAKRAGYEDIRLREAPAAYTDHLLYPDITEVPPEHRAEWVRMIDPDNRDPAWMGYLTAAEQEQLLEEIHPKMDQAQQQKTKGTEKSTNELKLEK